MKRSYIALLRGINVGGRNKLPMKDLQLLCMDLGWSDISTYLQTGNILFQGRGETCGFEQQLEREVEKRFDLKTSVVVRELADFRQSVAKSPFSDQASSAASKVLLYTTKDPLSSDAVEVLQARAAAEEQVVMQDDVLWIYFPQGVGSSKLTPAIIDKAVGSPATGRNWNTVVKMISLAG